MADERCNAIDQVQKMLQSLIARVSQCQWRLSILQVRTCIRWIGRWLLRGLRLCFMLYEGEYNSEGNVEVEMSSSNDTNSSESENVCVVCFKTVEIFSVGICDHPVCYECSTRMRVLCNQLECPICRQQMPQVFALFIRRQRTPQFT